MILPLPFNKLFRSGRTFWLSLVVMAVFVAVPVLAQGSYIDNGNGTITDTKTGLIWQKTDDGIPRTWQEALEYSENMTLAGCTTWRLPNRKELRSLVDRSRRNPAIDPVFDSQSDKYWTSSPTRWFKRVWSVDFRKGRLSASDPRLNFHYIRAVSGGCELDVTPPEVSSVLPAANATGVIVTSAISATFSEEIDQTTLTAATFGVLEDNLAPVSGVVSYSNGTAVFTPDTPFAYGTSYTVTLTTGIQDMVGNALAADYQWAFTSELEADLEAPVGSISINSGAVKVNEISVNLILSASDNSGMVTSMQLRQDGGAWSAWEPYVSIKQLTLSPGDGMKTVEVQFQDASGNVSIAYGDTIELDTVPPTIAFDPVVSPTGMNSQSVSGQTESGSTVTVSIDTWATISGIAVNGTDWQCSLSGFAVGANTVTVTATDVAGNRASTSAVLEYDNVPPAGTISINSGDAFANSTGVTLYLASSDNYPGALFYRLANSGTTWSAWQQLAASTIPWQLAAGDGEKTVFVQYQDNSGNISETLTAAISLDTVPPALSIDQDFGETGQDSIVFSGSREDEALVSIFVAGSATVGQIDYPASTTWASSVTSLEPGVNTITVTGADQAGNTTDRSFSILYDTVAPSGSLTINHGAPLTGSEDVLLVFAASDTGQIADLRVRDQGGAWTSWQPFISSLGWTLSIGDGIKTVEAELRDASGNVSALLSDSIVLDTLSPSVTVFPVVSPVTSAEIDISGSRESGTVISVVAPGAWSGPIDYTDPTGWTCSLVLVEGDNPITVTATDSVGNSSSASISIFLDSRAEFTVDAPLTPTGLDNQVLTGTMESGSTVTVTADAPAMADAVIVTSDTTWSCSVSVLVPGQNILTVASEDPLLNSGSLTTSIYVDISSPTGSMSINNGADQTSKSIVGLNLTVGEDSGGPVMVKARDAGGIWSGWLPYANVLIWTLPSGDGMKTVEVQFSDASGNTSPIYQDSITVDTVMPSVSIDPVASPTASSSQVISGSREAGAAVTVNVTGSLINQVSYPDETSWQCEAGLEGDYNYITAMATDTAGNLASDSAVIFYDNSTYLTVNPYDNPTNSSTLTLSGTREADAVITVAAPSATVSAVEYTSAAVWQCTLSNLAPGVSGVTITAADLLGNTAQQGISIMVDQAAPSGTVLINGDAPVTNSTTVTLTLGATDSETSVTSMRLRNSGLTWSSWVPLTPSKSWVLLAAEGIHAVEAQFMDEAGNISTTVSDDISLDRTAPSVTINPVLSPTDIVTQTISGTKEAGANISIAAPGVTVGLVNDAGTSWDCDLTLHEGINIITVLAADGASNTGSAATSITVDTIGVVSLDPVANPTNQSSVLISGQREAGASVSVDVVPAATVGVVSYPTATTWSCLLKDLLEGDNQIDIGTVDAMGNTGSILFVLTVDQTGPMVAIDTLSANPVTDPVLNLSGTMEVGAALVIDVPGASITTPVITGNSWSSTITLAQGANDIVVTARDAAGNTVSDSVTVTLDSIAEITIDPLSFVNTASQTLSGTIEPGGSVTQISADTAAVIGVVSINATTWSCPITLVEGANTLTVEVQDALGNPGQASSVIVLDTLAPTVGLDPIPSQVNQASQTITGSRSMDGGTISITSATALLSGVSYPTASTWHANLILGEGANTIQVIVTDPAGNSSSDILQIELDSTTELGFNSVPSPTSVISHSISGTQESGATVKASALAASISPLTVSDTTWQGSVSLVEGENIITVTAEDFLGNKSTLSSRVILDTEVPQVTIDPVASLLNDASLLLSGSRDSDGIVTVRRDNPQSGTAFYTAVRPTGYSWEQQLTLPDGNNTITVTAIDAAGNSSSASIVIAVDTTAIVSMNPISSPTNDPSHTLTGVRETDAVITVAVTGGSAGPVTYDDPNSWTCSVVLGEGANQIVVTATDASSNSNSITADIFLDTTPPDPVAITATDTFLGGSVALDWSSYPAESHDVSTFMVYASTTNFSDITDQIAIRELSPGATDYTVKGMINGEIWYFAVVAVDAAGNLDPNVAPVSAVPTVQGIDGYVTDAMTGLPLREVEVMIPGYASVSTNTDGYFHLAGLPVGSYDLTISGAGYIESVSSSVNVQAAAMTRIAVGLDPQIILPSVPINVSALAGDGQITISWDDIADTDLAGYQLYRFVSPVDTNPALVNSELINGTFYVDMGLVNNQTYYYTVRSEDQAGYVSGDSTMASATPVAGPPLPATDFSVVLNGDNTATLSWNKSPTSGVEFYAIYQDAASGVIDYAVPAATVTAGTTEWTTPVLAAGASYYYGLRTVKAGIEESNTSLVVSVTVPLVSYNGPQAVVAAPTSGRTVSGNMLTVEGALVQGVSSQVKHVTFQYRQRATSSWHNIAPASAYSLNPDTDSPYFIHWDVVTDMEIGEYELRAVATALDNSVDPSPETIMITIDHANAKIRENSNRKYHHRLQKQVRRFVRNQLKFYSTHAGGSYSVTVPEQTLDGDTELAVEIPKDEELADKLIGLKNINRFLRLTLASGQKQFAAGKEVEITIPYPDANDDGIVDGTTIAADQLQILWYNPQAKQWENSGLVGLVVDQVAKTVTVKTAHFSVFAVIGTDTSGGIAASVSSLDFGQQTVGTTSAPLTLTVTQDGGSPVDISPVFLSGLHAGDVAISQDTCSNTTLAPAGTCLLELTFTPSTLGSKTASLTIPSNDATNPNVLISLSGLGVEVDSDGDGMPDSWEIANGLNPLVDDAGLDPDGDGATNLQEFLSGTDPNLPGGAGQQTPVAHVPVFDGFWQFMGAVVGLLFFMRRRRRRV